MNAAFSPEQMNKLRKALDLLVEKYGPFNDEEKQALAEALIGLGERNLGHREAYRAPTARPEAR